MNETYERPSLRALGVGEIFDRAVTMYVRNFVVFTLIVLTLLVPIGIGQYVYANAGPLNLTQMMQQIEHPGTAAPYDSAQFAAIVVIGLVALLLAPFTNNAVAVGVAGIYAGRRPSYRDGFARVLRRWAPLLGSTILCGLILIGAYVALVVVAMIAAVIAALMVQGMPILSIPLIVIGALFVLALLLLFMLLVVCCAFALYATTIEERSPGDAIGQAFRRIFNRREFRKALLIALAYLAIEIGAIVLSATVGLLILNYLHNTALQLAASTIVNAMLTAFITVLLAVYYYDVRTRSEGLDLEVALERLTAPS
ncbi:MAG TPA: hypothetical protein VMA98_07595 [Candidatus Acidoferrales bacterium]|nr:hypothetical protein [Candidatus Acidoferrales bacterium]